MSAKGIFNYGSVGQISYTEKGKVWITQRLHRSRPSLQLVGSPETHVQPSRVFPKDFPSFARERENTTNAIIQDLPELLAAKTLVYQLSEPTIGRAAPSEELVDVSNTRLLSCCEVYDAYLKQIVTAFIWAGGECGEILTMSAALHHQTARLRKASAPIVRAAPSEKDIFVFDAALGPIRSITSATTHKRSYALLGVLYSSKLVFYQTRIRSRATSTKSQGEYDIEAFAPRVELAKLAERNSFLSVGNPIVNITFDPSNPHTVAMIDTSGFWVILQVQIQHSPRVDVIKHGRTKDKASVPFDPESFQDGWHRVTFVCDYSHFVVFDRTHCTLHDNRDDFKQTAQMAFEQIEYDKPQLILDANGDLCSKGILIIATNSHVHVLKLVSHRSRVEDGLSSMSFQIVASLAHFRNEEDTSLRLLTHHRVEENKVVAILYSQKKGLPAEYLFWINGSPEPQEPAVYFYEPCRIECPLLDHTKSRESRPISVEVIPLQDVKSGPKLGSRARLLQLCILTNDLSMKTVAYSFSSDGQNIDYVNWKQPQTHFDFNAGQLRHRSFVVDDVEDDGKPEKAQEGWRRLIKHRMRHSSWTAKSASNIEKHMARYGKSSLSHLLERYFEPQVELERTHMSQINLQSLRDMITPFLSAAEHNPDTLADLFNQDLRLDDVEAASKNFQNLLQQTTFDQSTSQKPTGAFDLHTMRTPPELSLDAFFGQDTSLASLYRNTIVNWIGSLPRQVPSSIRLAKEKQARDVVANVYLSSIIAQSSTSEPPEPLYTPSSQPMPSSQPISSSIPSSQTTSGFQPPSSHEQEETLPLPSNLTSILNLWTPNTNPNTLDTTQLTNKEPSALTGSALSDIDRAKLERRQQRQREKEERRQARKRQRLGLGESDVVARQPAQGGPDGGGGGEEAVMPGIWMSSQGPNTAARGQAETRTQMRVEGQDEGFGGVAGVASQILPGAFGGRQGIGQRRDARRKGKGPKRKAGF